MAKAKKPKVLEEAELIERCCAAFGYVGGRYEQMHWNEWVRLSWAEEAIVTALEAGRVEGAKAMAEALPERLRGVSLIRIAEHLGEGLAEAKQAALEAIGSDEGWGECSSSVYPSVESVLAVRLMALGHEDLAAPAEAIIEGAFDETRSRDSLIVLIEVLRLAGREEEVRALLERWRSDDIADLCVRMKDGFNVQDFMAHFCDRPEVTLALLRERGDIEPRTPQVGDDALERIAASWTEPQLKAFIEVYDWSWGRLSGPMARAGRSDEYTKYVFETLADHTEPPWQGFESRLLFSLGVNALDDIRAYMNANEDDDGSRFGPTLRVRVGDWTIGQAVDAIVAYRKPDGSVMSVIHDLLSLVSNTLEWGVEASDYDPVWVAIDDHLAMAFRTSHDRGVEHSTRSRRNDVRVALHLREGDDAAAEAELTQNLADLKSIHGFCKDSYGRNGDTESLISRAIRAGLPTIALKAGRKVSKGERPRNAARVASAFLPADPVGALKALDSLAGKDNPNGVLIWDGRRTSPPLPVKLWRSLPSSKTP